MNKARAWAIAHPERIRELARRWYHKNKNNRKFKTLRADYRHRDRYGITLKQKIAMKKLQNNRCGICTKVFRSSWHTCVDHDHKTKHIRGLLCRTCNTLLGHAHEDTELLQKAINYLRSHS